MNRQGMLGRVHAARAPWDMLIVGGGTPGVGTAVDAASGGIPALKALAGPFPQGDWARIRALAAEAAALCPVR